jgi:post-segregation antitoxin (ccd killing protein)
MMSVTVTVRIPKELKEEARRYDISISRIVRRALEEELRRRKLEDAREAAKRVGEFFSKLSEEEVVEWIKMARRER